jgi:ComF family protein
VAGRGRCGRCLARPPPLDATVAVLAYRFPVDRLLPRFKFHGDLAAGWLLAQLMAAALPGALGGSSRPAAVVPVPLHPSRLRQRGYDQALELARPVAAALGLPLCAGALHRVRATQAQTTLDAAGRRGNVRRAFACRPGALPGHVVLLDDVMTTGATLGECTRALRRAGVARVDAWVLARAPPPGRGDQPSA